LIAFARCPQWGVDKFLDEFNFFAGIAVKVQFFPLERKNKTRIRWVRVLFSGAQSSPGYT